MPLVMAMGPNLNDKRHHGARAVINGATISAECAQSRGRRALGRSGLVRVSGPPPCGGPEQTGPQLLYLCGPRARSKETTQ